MHNNSNNGLSPTMVIRYINSRLGSTVQYIELSEKDIMKIVYQQSIQTFSQFFPYLPMVVLTAADKINPTRQSNNDYRIPNPWNLQLLSIQKSILTSSEMYGGGWIGPFLTNPIDTILLNDRISMMIPPTIVEFWPPNKVTIKQNYYNMSGKICIQFKAVHPQHLKTIEPNLRDQFLHLCLDDVLLSLYPIRHRFQNITTPYGSLQPFYEMVDNAKSDRDALLDLWHANMLTNSEAKKVWIA